MISDFLSQFKKFWNTPTVVAKPMEIISSGLKVVLLFAIFYFAIFKFNASWQSIRKDLIEFISVSLSLFSAWLIFWGYTEIYYKTTKKRIFTTFALTPLKFLFVYSLMIGFLYLIKESLYSPDKNWVWRYYWRHLPYAFVIFGVYLYREYKNTIIENLVNQSNARLENAKRKEIIDKNHSQDGLLLNLPVDGINKRILLNNISHISVMGHYLDIYIQKEGKSEFISVRKPLMEIFEELPKTHFIKIHRSHIINIDYISEIKKYKRQFSIKLCNKQFSLPISRSNLSNVLANLEARV